MVFMRCSEKANYLDLAHDICVDVLEMDNTVLNNLIENKAFSSYIYKRISWYLKNTKWKYHKQYMSNLEPLSDNIEYYEAEAPLTDHEIANLMDDTEIRLLAAYCTEGTAIAVHKKYGVHHVTVGQYLKRIREKIIKYYENRDTNNLGQ